MGGKRQGKNRRRLSSATTAESAELLFEQDHRAVARQESEGGLDTPHRPVLLQETMELLAPARGGLFVDATLGLGGHSERLLNAFTSVRVIGIDRDSSALLFAVERLKGFGARFQAVHADYRQIADVLRDVGIEQADGILADLGVSSLQLDTPNRGFSFREDAPLDMRMNQAGDEETAAELLARLPETEIARIIYEYGEERHSRRIARRIVERKERGEPIETTLALANLVRGAIRRTSKEERVHPATRTFQALRIAVNRELERLDEFIEEAIGLLSPGGRLAIISFHSLEDRIVKHTLRRLSGQCECDPRLPLCSCGARKAVILLTRRPITPGEEEVNENPRARSAKLRGCERLVEAT